MEITKRVLVLIFTNGLGKNVSLTINDPAEDLEDEEISRAMDEIVECIQDTVEIVEHIRPVYNFKASEVAGSLFDEDAE